MRARHAYTRYTCIGDAWPHDASTVHPGLLVHSRKYRVNAMNTYTALQVPRRAVFVATTHPPTHPYTHTHTLSLPLRPLAVSPSAFSLPHSRYAMRDEWIKLENEMHGIACPTRTRSSTAREPRFLLPTYPRSSRRCFQRASGLGRMPLEARPRAPTARVTSRHQVQSPLRGSLYRPGTRPRQPRRRRRQHRHHRQYRCRSATRAKIESAAPNYWHRRRRVRV